MLNYPTRRNRRLSGIWRRISHCRKSIAFCCSETSDEVELVWNGKTNEVCNIVLPFQTIEQVDEPRAEKPSDASLQMGLFSTDERGRQLKGWTNKLIWGDNKLILSSLKNGRYARRSKPKADSS